MLGINHVLVRSFRTSDLRDDPTTNGKKELKRAIAVGRSVDLQTALFAGGGENRFGCVRGRV